jgi:hypothetical protein|tara:strand:- start:368 stop:532 length:165 start_codon:yes stop_codon:yes gene_type:complete
MKQKYKIEYLNLCNIFGSVEVDSIISFNMYCKEREKASQQTILNEIQTIINITN